MGTAGMVLGILAVVFFWVPVLNFVLIAVGLPLSIVGLVVGRQRGEPVGMAIAGIVLNCIPLAINIIILLIIGSLLGILAAALGEFATEF